MDRKTSDKPAPPTTTFSNPGKDAIRSKVLPSQKSSAKSNTHISSGKRLSKALEDDLLQQSTTKVSQLVANTLPPFPHVLSIPTAQILTSRIQSDECAHPLFTLEEIKRLQYMTLINITKRDCLLVEPTWGVEAISPASAGSKTSRTPNGEAETKKPEYKRKIKFGDYAKGGKTAATQANTTVKHRLPAKPSLANDTKGPTTPSMDSEVQAKPAATPAAMASNVSAGKDNVAETRSAVPNEKSALLDPPTNRNVKAAVSSESVSKAHGDSTLSGERKSAKNGSEQSAIAKSNSTTNPQSKALSNGTSHAEPSSQKATSKRPLPDNEASSPAAKKPKVSANGPSAKRPIAEDDLPSPATKKAKLSNGIQSKDTKLSSQLPPSQPSQANTKKENALKQSASLESGKKPAASKSNISEPSKSVSNTASKPAATKIPPLLSPTLPPQVLAANGHGETPVPRSSSTIKASSTLPDSPKSNLGMAQTDGAHAKSRLQIPRLISPILPPEVEAALAARDARLAISKDPSSGEKRADTPRRAIDTVADRHEKSRQPNAPGIARKVVKNGKQTNSARAVDSTAQTSKEQPSLIVKLKYKKRQRVDIERILKLRADPAPYDRTETSNKDVAEESSKAKVGDRASSKEDRRNSLDKPRPNERNGASKRPASSSTSSTAQKRPRAEEPQQVNNKRLKPADHIQSSKPSTPTTPAFKSPAISAPSSAQKVVTDTPKKGDSIKGTALARINSTDGITNTPQPSQTSIPGSAEKSAPVPRNSSIIKYRVHPGPLGVKLKREWERLLHLKRPVPPPVPPTVEERKLGYVVGLECSLTYLAYFDFLDTALVNEHKAKSSKNWDDLEKLHVGIAKLIEDVPVLEVLGLQIKIVNRYRLNSANASSGFTGISPATVTQNVFILEQLWKELDYKMSNELVQTFEESISGNRRGFNPSGNFRQFMAISLAKLKRYAVNEGLHWDQKLELVD